MRIWEWLLIFYKFPQRWVEIVCISSFAYSTVSPTDTSSSSFVLVDSNRTSTPRKSKSLLFWFCCYVVLRTKGNRSYGTSNTNYGSTSTSKNRPQQKKNASSGLKRNYEILHLPSIPVVAMFSLEFQIKSTWKSILQVEFSDLMKMTMKELPTVSVMLFLFVSVMR